ncbi:MAG: Flp family type IVb pilin, partial [Terriglobales bacterium]
MRKNLVLTNLIKRLCTDESGATAIEYGLIVAL